MIIILGRKCQNFGGRVSSQTPFQRVFFFFYMSAEFKSSSVSGVVGVHHNRLCEYCSSARSLSTWMALFATSASSSSDSRIRLFRWSMPNPVEAETGITCLNVRGFLGIMSSGNRAENSGGQEGACQRRAWDVMTEHLHHTDALVRDVCTSVWLVWNRLPQILSWFVFGCFCLMANL